MSIALLKAKTIEQHTESCIAPHVALEDTLGPPSTTQRLLNITLRACIAPHVALENTMGPHIYGVPTYYEHLLILLVI